jgi:hypothetical protein
MKRQFVLMIVAAAFALLPSFAAAEEEVYWNINESGSTTITPKSESASKSGQPKDAKSLAEKEVYDSGEPPTPADVDDEEAESQTAVRRPIQSTPSANRAAPADTPQRRPQVRQRRNAAPSGADESAPRNTVKKPDTKRGGPTAEPSATVEKPKTDQPKPSQVEAEPAEPKTKLPWGKDK